MGTTDSWGEVFHKALLKKMRGKSVRYSFTGNNSDIIKKNSAGFLAEEAAVNTEDFGE